MKSKLLLVLGVILALMIAVGCSNESRTTAPASVDNAFNLPNDDSARLETEQTLKGPNPRDPISVSVEGIYSMTKYGCQSIAVESDIEDLHIDYIELAFPVGSPQFPKNGSLIRVKGAYYQIPNTICNLIGLIEIAEFRIISAPIDQEAVAPSQF